MTIDQRLEIDKKAYDFRNKVKITTPIDFEKLVKEGLGGTLKDTTKESIPDAQIVRSGDSFVISVNKQKDVWRQRFSIAHEIGHLILDMGYDINSKSFNGGDLNTSFDREGDTQQEYAANEFAAALLMPKDEFRFFVDKNTNNKNMVSIETVADHFNVSIQAALTRGKFLGIFKW